MRGSDINTLTMEQYFKMIDENHAPGMVNKEFRRTMEGDIEDMTIDEYMKYEAEMKRKSWRDSQMDAITMKMDAQYKEIQSRAKCNHYGENIEAQYRKLKEMDFTHTMELERRLEKESGREKTVRNNGL
nr:hypothetical protein [Tanacetum cinerariifolium]GEY18041.1 hypothetical protein [Tanacetum cinerariifolium]